jgi:hypothetical protein
MYKLITFILLFSISGILYAQTSDSLQRKQITITRSPLAPKIDGILDDEAWQDASIATDFVERRPTNGRPIPDSLHTEVKIVYNDRGIYFGATMNDPDPSKIMKELTQRDGVGASDFFFILLNGYNDRQQSMQFIVTAAGVQYDAKMTQDGEDSSWDAVWYSAVKINENNWVAEIFLPYSEIRFPQKDPQVWGLNMEREFKRAATRYSWSPIDNTKGSFTFYDGEVYGIHNIETPVRLSFQPYLSSYINNFEGQTKSSYNGGLDLRYGINDAFTLDMILIPDFGQTRFDETILNLSAFDVQYDEQRQFFNEGTELFSKGNLFYSRRVGGASPGRIELDEDEKIVSLPASVDLINAMKISGRTTKGLGIGFFNAITQRTYATVQNIETLENKRVMTDPLTGYNVLVLDQRFGSNSSVSFVNTNTLREGNYRDANVSGLYMNLTNKANTWNHRAGAEGSWVLEDKIKFGAELNARSLKISGKNRIGGGIDLKTRDYDINDLGFSTRTNYITYFGFYSYRILQPQGFLNEMNLNFNLHHDRRLEPDMFSMLLFNFNSRFVTKDFFFFGGGFETTPFGLNDHYEARRLYRYVKIPTYYDQWLWFETDFRKKLSVKTSADWYKYDEKDRHRVIVEIEPRYRISDRFKLNYDMNFIYSQNEQGFVAFDDEDNDNIIFGQRTRNTFVNSLGGDYIFTNKISLNLEFRHYLTEVAYTRFYNLETNGELNEIPAYDGNFDTTFNVWNLDLRFNWWFAPEASSPFCIAIL